MLDAGGRLPDAVVACVGGGSNAIGTVPRVPRRRGVRLIGVEAGGDGADLHAASRRGRSRCCTARAATCSATTARSSKRTRSPPGSTTPASAPSTPCWRTAARRVRGRHRRRGARRRSSASAAPRASSPRWSRPTRSTPPKSWRGSSGRTRRARLPLRPRRQGPRDRHRAERDEDRTPALAIYLMAGDEPARAAVAAVAAGATAIEVGIPFSDPLADGPTIQARRRPRWMPG